MYINRKLNSSSFWLNHFANNIIIQADLCIPASHRKSKYCHLEYPRVTGKHTLNAIHKFI